MVFKALAIVFGVVLLNLGGVAAFVLLTKDKASKGNWVLGLYNNFTKIPFGRWMFSMVFRVNAPYFLTIGGVVTDLKAGYAEVTMSQNWFVQNHIGTVHAIAVCNLVEMTMGLVAESTIPKHLRWLPMGMDVSYLKKATGKLTGTSTIDADKFFELASYPGEVHCPVEIKNAQGVVVTKAVVRMWISQKPEKKKDA